MSIFEPRLAVKADNTLGEGPVWSSRHGRLFWTDIEERALWWHEPVEGRSGKLALPERLGSFAIAEDGRLLGAFEKRIALIDPDTGRDETVAAFETEIPGNRANDGRPDRFGGFVFGTMDESPRHAPNGTIYRWTAARGLKPLRRGIAISNSIAFSPDGRTIYFADTQVKEILAATFDPDTDEIFNERRFASLESEPGAADGSAVDSAGFLWNAQWGGGRLVRYASDGRVDRVVPLPARQPTCPTFAGAGLATLFVTSARVGLDPSDGDFAADGQLYALTCEVAGITDTPVAL